MHLRSLFLALVATLVLGGSTRADFMFEFAQGGNVASSFTVAQGSTINIQVYLLQTNGPTMNNTNLTDNGLTDGGVALQYSSSAPFNIANPGSISPNSAFGGPNNTSLSSSGGTTTAALQVHADPTPVFAPSTGPNAGSILLGTFTFTGSTVGQGTTLTALPNSMSANNVDGAGNNLDSLIQQNSAVINVTAVPEPGSLILCGLAASALGFGAWRRRKAASVVG